MPRLAANLSMLFQEVPFPDRFGRAARAGFRGVECQFPYAWDSALLARRLADHDLVQVLHNLPAGDWQAGERGLACLPGREAEFRDGVEQAIAWAGALGCRRLNCLAGIAPDGADPAALRETFIGNLRRAARRLADEDILLLIEPINTRDMPGFFLNGSRQALDIIDAVGAANLRLQYDAYHMQVMEGDLARTIAASLDRIGHIQIADNPGRHEPGSGEIDFDLLLRHLDAIGYDGWVGCEYIPATTTEAGLGWARPWLEGAGG